MGPIANRRMLRRVLIALAVAGALISGLLLTGSSGGADSLLSRVCAPGPSTDCASVIASRWGGILGLPTSAWGFAYFGLVAVWYCLCGLPNRAGRFRHGVIVAVVGAGAVVSALLMIEMLARLSMRCPWCIAVHAVNGFLVVGTLLAYPRHVAARPAGAEPESPRPTGAAIASVAFCSSCLAAAAVAFFSAQYYYRQSGLYQGALLDATNTPEYVVWRHAQSPKVELPIRDDDPTVGERSAAHRLVVFMDFQCPHCREFEAFAPRLLSHVRGRLRIVFKHYPLSRDCSDALPAAQDVHRFACQAAIAYEAARKCAPGMTSWRYRHALFEHSAEFAEAPWTRLAVALTVDRVAFESAMSDASIRARIAEDVALARRLDLDGSGAMFLDGRRLYHWKITTADARPRLDELATFRLWDQLLGLAPAAAD